LRSTIASCIGAGLRSKDTFHLGVRTTLTPPSAPLSRARETGYGVRARRAAFAMRELVRLAHHEEMVSTLNGDRLGLVGKAVPWISFATAF
jgi:hypothetical protein